MRDGVWLWLSWWILGWRILLVLFLFFLSRDLHTVTKHFVITIIILSTSNSLYIIWYGLTKAKIYKYSRKVDNEVTILKVSSVKPIFSCFFIQKSIRIYCHFLSSLLSLSLITIYYNIILGSCKCLYFWLASFTQSKNRKK